MTDEKLLKLFERQEEINVYLFVLLNIIDTEVDAFNDKIDKLAYEIHKLNWNIIELENKIQEIKKKME